MKVVVAIDSTPSSQAIVDAVVKMNWYEGTELHLVTVLHPGAHSSDENAESAEFDEIENIAIELRSSLRHCEIFFFAREGDPKTVILELADELHADLIIVGSNCKNTVERLLIGSVSQGVIHDARCPVIVAKTPCSLAREVSPAFKNILIPVDNSIFSDAAIRWLTNFSWSSGTTFVIAAIVEEDSDPEDVRQSTEHRASDLSKILKTNNITLETVANSSSAIVDLAQANYADLIVLGTHGRTGIKKLILGELAEDISHSAPCALAIVGGLVGHDESWHRTESFAKVKSFASTFDEGRGRESESSPNVVPAGF